MTSHLISKLDRDYVHFSWVVPAKWPSLNQNWVVLAKQPSLNQNRMEEQEYIYISHNWKFEIWLYKVLLVEWQHLMAVHVGLYSVNFEIRRDAIAYLRRVYHKKHVQYIMELRQNAHFMVTRSEECNLPLVTSRLNLKIGQSVLSRSISRSIATHLKNAGCSCNLHCFHNTGVWLTIL